MCHKKQQKAEWPVIKRDVQKKLNGGGCLKQSPFYFRY